MPDDDCLFCKIGSGTRCPTHDDELVTRSTPEPAATTAPVHFMVILHRHVPSALDLTDDDAPVTGRLFAVAAKLAREKGIADSGFRLATNSGPHANQSVFHFHLHCIGGRQLGHEG
jgi:histidine triad (HIT) family protein